MSALLAIARHSFLEVVRQPVHGVVVVVTLVTYAVSPRLAMFSLGGELSLLKDFGSSTLLLSGWVLACLGASHVVRREIETHTTLTLLAKPVSRETFLAGKFLGVSLAVTLSVYLFLLALLLTARQGPVLSPRFEFDWPVLAGGLGAFLIALLGAVLRSYVWGRSFTSSLTGLTAVTLTAGFALAAAFDAHWTPQPFGAGFDFDLARAAVLSLCSLIVLVAFAISVSVWIGSGGTFFLTALLFLVGLSVSSLPEPWRTGLTLVPDFQVFWVGDLFYLEGGSLPISYLGGSCMYALVYVLAFLTLGGIAFRIRSL